MNKSTKPIPEETNPVISSTKPVEDKKPMCGIVMPISKLGDYSSDHWRDVFSILEEVIRGLNLNCRLVSDSDDSGILQKRIVHNLYNDDIVICDVSGKNPNVMFELGMRLTFDKPIIIIKDEITDYSFDTAPIEHLTYPRDLRYTTINEFKITLKDKIIGTLKASKEPGYTTFLKHFGEFEIAKLEKKNISGVDFIIQKLNELDSKVEKINRNLYTKKHDYLTINEIGQPIDITNFLESNTNKHLITMPIDFNYNLLKKEDDIDNLFPEHMKE